MIDKDTVAYMASLSRLSFSDKELEQYTHDLNEIFNYAQELINVDTKNIEPSAHAIPLSNVFKDDQVIPHAHVDRLLANAPDPADQAYRVPRILTD